MEQQREKIVAMQSGVAGGQAHRAPMPGQRVVVTRLPFEHARHVARGGRPVGADAQRRVERRERLVQAAEKLCGRAQVVVRLGEARLQFGGAPIGGEGVFEATERGEADAKVVMKLRAIGRLAQRFAQLPLRFERPSRLLQRQRQIVARLPEARAELDRAGERGDRGVEIAARPLDVSQGVVRLDVGRERLDRATVHARRIVERSLHVQQRAQRQVPAGIVGGDAHHFPERRDRLRGPPGLQRDRTEGDQRFHVARIALENRAMERFGLGQSPCDVMLSGELEQAIRRRHRERASSMRRAR